jgi:uncharacterized alkaline shock family protein YloU
VPTASTPGRSLVTSRAVADIVRTAALGSYGVSGLGGGGLVNGLLARFGVTQPGIRVMFGDAVRPTELEAVDGAALAIELDLTVAFGVPVAEVARQVETAVRYTLRHAIGREPDRVTIRIGRLRHEHGIAPATGAASGEPRSSDLAESGTDVA